MKNNTRFGKSSRFKKIFESDMSFSNKSKLAVKIYGGFLSKVPVYLALIALSVIFIVPFFYMIGHSLMAVDDLINKNVKWLPRAIKFINYEYALYALDYFSYLIRTVLIVGVSVAAQVMSSAFVAYGLARVKFKGNGAIFALIVFMLIVPPQVIAVPNYMMYANFGWLDQAFHPSLNGILPLVIPCLFSLGLNGGLLVFIFRQFFRGMPAELENAALIDGTGIYGAYFRVILPNAKPAILVTSILSMVWQWNNSFEPKLYISQIENALLPMKLERLKDGLAIFGSQLDFNAGITMAATFLCVLPLIIVFLTLQRQFMKNMANSGLAN